MSHLLTNSETLVIRAVNGQELMDLLTIRQPDLLLLDIRMPIKSGLQCLREIRQRGYKFKIIAQTAFAMANERTQVIQAGCDGYLAKPFTRNDLFNCISEVLECSRPGDV